MGKPGKTPGPGQYESKKKYAPSYSFGGGEERLKTGQTSRYEVRPEPG